MADDGGLGELGDSLEKKSLGGLPVWVVGIGIALLVTVVWYFFRSRNSGTTVTEQVYDPNSADAGEQDTEPSNSDYGLPNGPVGDWLSENPGSSAYPVNQNSLPITNAQWGRYISDTLLSKGADPSIVTNAISKYLSGAGLTAAERAVINQGLELMSLPEGVLPIKDYTAPVTAVTPPGGFKLSGSGTTWAKITWSPVSNAKGYKVYVNNDVRLTTLSTFATLPFLKPNTQYTMGVTAIDKNTGKESAKGTFVVKTKK